MERTQADLKVGILILAAGGSRRLGRAKQLVEINGENLLRRMAKAAITSNASSVAVVLGHDSETMISQLSGLGLDIVINPDWQKGIGTSIGNGVKALANHDAILISVCDQPNITSEIFNELITRLHGSPTGIVASKYADTLGVPAVFASQHFPTLIALSDDEGAKSLITANEVDSIDFPLGAVDIDTPDDLDALIP